MTAILSAIDIASSLVVSNIDRRRADAVMQIAQLAAHQMPKLGVERAERLVHHERLRTSNDRAPERHPLAVAAGELGHPAIEQRLDAQQPGGLLNAGPDLRSRHALASQREADVLSDRKMCG